MDKRIWLKQHEWEPFSDKDGKARRICKACRVVDRIVGVRGIVTWPCVQISEAWTYEDFVNILHLCQVNERYISLIKLYPKSSSGKTDAGPYRVGIQIPSKYGLELYPSLEHSLSKGIAFNRFFHWLVSIEFNLQKDPEFNELLRQKAYR